MSKIWWTKMEHVDDFVAHYSELSDSEIVMDVRRSIASFANHRPEGDDFGAKMVRKALDRINEKHDHAVEAGSLGGIAKAAKTITAAATTREGVDVLSNSESGRCAHTTGCDHSQEAPTRKSGDESSDAGNGAALKYATSCNPLTADGDIREDSLDIRDTGDRGYMESGTSANHYDQETTKASTNNPAGAGVNLDSTHTISPDASDCKAEGVVTNGMPITRNGCRAACTSATSVQTITTAETLDKAGAGEVSPESVSASSPALPSPVTIKTDPKPTKKAKAEVKPKEQKYPHGEFENIMLTTDEYVKLCERLDNADELINEADQYFEAQPDKAKKYKSHYAMLLSWDRRRKDAERPKQGYMTSDDISKKNYQESKARLEAMFSKGRKTA